MLLALNPVPGAGEELGPEVPLAVVGALPVPAYPAGSRVEPRRVEGAWAAVPHPMPVSCRHVDVCAGCPLEAKVLSQAEARRGHELFVCEAQARVRWECREPRPRPGPAARAQSSPPVPRLVSEELLKAGVLEGLAELSLPLAQGLEAILPAV